jgi:hypothetical protein
MRDAAPATRSTIKLKLAFAGSATQPTTTAKRAIVMQVSAFPNAALIKIVQEDSTAIMRSA